MSIEVTTGKLKKEYEELCNKAKFDFMDTYTYRQYTAKGLFMEEILDIWETGYHAGYASGISKADNFLERWVESMDEIASKEVNNGI